MRTLLDAYKAAKDNTKRTGASPCPGSYMEEMEELFGRKAIISHSHALDVGLHTTPTLEDETGFCGIYTLHIFIAMRLFICYHILIFQMRQKTVTWLSN